MLKKSVFIIMSLMALSANASVGVVLGSNKWADDGMPQLAPNEQVKVFMCHGKNSEMSGAAAQSCAMSKCKRHFKISPNLKVKDPEGIIGGHCKNDGWSEKTNVYNIAAVGDKGNNQFMFTKALGDPSRKVAFDYLKSNNFPLKDSNIVFDIYDTGSNGTDTMDGTSKEPALSSKPIVIKP